MINSIEARSHNIIMAHKMHLIALLDNLITSEVSRINHPTFLVQQNKLARHDSKQ
jgi:hypothetical protein